MTENPRPADVATAFIDAFARQDMAAIADYISDDIVFESPRVRLTGAEAFLEAVGQFAQIVVKVATVSVVGDDERAMIMYDMETGPFGTLRAVDHLVVRDGRITSDVLVFDTHEVRKAPATTGDLVMIRYETRPEAAEGNQALIERVFAELAAEDPGRLRYLSLRLADGVNFVHIGLFGEDSPLGELSAFKEFQAGIGDRVVAPPNRTEATLIGSYRFGE
jgi:limonene-1,2-epoxide hydrolase